MTTFSATRASSTLPVSRPHSANALCVAYGKYAPTADPSPADIIELCRVPKGARVFGGWVRAEDIDTDANETLDIDIGWAANGTDVADPDGFGNLGVWVGDAVAGYLPEGGILMPLNGVLADQGWQDFAAETIIQATVVDDAATFTAGTISVVVFYTVP